MCNDRVRVNDSKGTPKEFHKNPKVTRKTTQVWVPKGTKVGDVDVSKRSWIPKLT